MDGYKVYRYYLATRLHFTTDKYNVFEQKGNVKCTRESFDRRNDKHIFNKLARKYATDRDVIDHFVANFAYGNTDVIYDISISEENHLEWIKRKESRTQVFIDDLAKFLNELECNNYTRGCLFNWNGVELPVSLSLFLGKKVTIETMVMIQEMYPYLDAWKRHASNVWENEFRTIEKLTGFVKYNKSKALTVWNNFRQELDEL